MWSTGLLEEEMRYASFGGIENLNRRGRCGGRCDVRRCRRIALSGPDSVSLVSSFSNPCVLVYAPGLRMDNTQVCLGQVCKWIAEDSGIWKNLSFIQTPIPRADGGRGVHIVRHGARHRGASIAKSESIDLSSTSATV